MDEEKTLAEKAYRSGRAPNLIKLLICGGSFMFEGNKYYLTEDAELVIEAKAVTHEVVNGVEIVHSPKTVYLPVDLSLHQFISMAEKLPEEEYVAVGFALGMLSNK